MSSFGNQHSFLSSPHRDVLGAPIPDSSDGKERFSAELKSRAKGAISSKAFPDALLLYEKASEVFPDDSTLYANQSLVHFNMGHWKLASETAQTAVEKDATYVKGYWRHGQALSKLEKYDQALKTYERALKLDPNNKAIKKEVEKMKVLEEEFQKKKLEEPSSSNGVKTEPAGNNPFEKKPTAKPKSSSKPSSPDSEKMDVDKDSADGDTFTKSEHVKGYKIVNGKKTTFFHNELSDEARKLIGDIAPKRLDPSTTIIPADAQGKNNTSAWNKAGTWEERDLSSWAKDSVKNCLVGKFFTLDDSSPAPGATATITKLSKCDGHASFASVRGKKRYIYEFALKIEWKFETNTAEDDARGSMTFPDFDGTCLVGEGYDLGSYEVTSCTDSNLVPLLDRFVRNSGLRDIIHDSLDDWVRLFKETY
eukprot:CAMPEP_0194210246 /NCGR_PEP_ID=MMETSP0156-20130528/8115_1 /TAXON_ID=33649 /ORGANISM="Thalassionema nitzschioides, Strain L26-B" /LENGTH=421 /DNA_ID=CAMNT_0038937571 /DNA_START=115 /DNA_END=1380 /DNA_ORIENTATION=-